MTPDAITRLADRAKQLWISLGANDEAYYLFYHLDRYAKATLAQQGKAGGETITIQEAWEAAGGNPGIKATKQELIDALRTLDEVCDEADATPPAHYPEAGNMVPAGIVGEVVEIGDDESGQPRILIHTTREEIKAHVGNLLFKQVTVAASASTPKTQEKCNGFGGGCQGMDCPMCEGTKLVEVKQEPANG